MSDPVSPRSLPRPIVLAAAVHEERAPVPSDRTVVRHPVRRPGGRIREDAISVEHDVPHLPTIDTDPLPTWLIALIELAGFPTRGRSSAETGVGQPPL